MKCKIFLPYPVTYKLQNNIFRYDYTQSIRRQMRCDTYGFYHSDGHKIILERGKIKHTHFVQGWNFGNNNVLSMPVKITECVDYLCESNNKYYVAYIIPYREEAKEVFRIFLYSIDLDDSRVLYQSDKVNIFDCYKSEQIFSTGINGNLSINEDASGVILTWHNKSCHDDIQLKCYSLNLSSGVLHYELEALPDVNNNTISTIISNNTKSYIHYHKVNDDEDLYVCVIEPITKRQLSPAIVVCLGGPNISIPDFSDDKSIYERLRQNGFYVIIPLRRGVIGITPKWTVAISGKAGILDIQDIIRGSEFVLTQYATKIDINRVGIYGASYGGFSSLLIAGKHNTLNTFKAVVSHCGMSDLERYPYECYGNPSDVIPFYGCSDDYKQTVKKISPYCYIDKWSVPVLLVHTIDDSSVWFGQSVRAYNRGVKYHKNVNLVLARGPHSYHIQNGEKLINLIINFFALNL